jgi:rod shape-determining protein MreD
MKVILFIFFSYALSLLQFSFLPAVIPFLPIPNLLIVFTICYTVFEDPNLNGAFWLAAIAGFMNDLMSPYYFGLYVVIFFSFVYFIKFILKNYVQPSFVRRV